MECGGLVVRLCPTLCDPMDYSLPGSSVHGISQERIPEWVAMFCSRGSPRQGVELVSPALAGGFSTTESPDTGSKYYNFSKAVYLSESINSYQLGMSSLTFSFISFLWTFFDCVLMKFLSYFHALLLGSAVILPKGAHLLIFWELFLAMIRFLSRFQTIRTLLYSLVPYSVLYNVQYSSAWLDRSHYSFQWIPCGLNSLEEEYL